MAWVLGISMALVIVGLGSLWLANAPSLSGPGGQTAISAHLPPAKVGSPPAPSVAGATPG